MIKEAMMLSVATAAVSYFIAQAELLDRPRSWLTAKSGLFGKLIGCGYCLSHWISYGAGRRLRCQAVRDALAAGLCTDNPGRRLGGEFPVCGHGQAVVKEDGALRKALPEMWGEDAPEGAMLWEEENQCGLHEMQIQD